MSHVLRIGVVDQIAYFRAYNDDGTGKTDLTSATDGLSLSAFRIGLASISIASLSNKAADNTAHADGAIRAVAGNLYTIDLPDTVTATQTPSIGVRGSFTGGVIEPVPHPIVNYDPALAAVGALTSLGATAPAGWINAAAIVAAALNGKGDWNIGKTGYELTPGERTALATLIDATLLDAGDATDLIASIVTRIGNTNVDEASFVAAIKAALFDAGSAANKLAVDASGRVTVGTNADKSGYSLTTAPPTAAENATAVRSELTVELGLINTNLDAPVSSIGGGSGGDDAATIYTYFVDGTRPNAFKADLTGVAMAGADGDTLKTLSDQIDTIAVSTNAGGKASKTADAGAVLTGSNTSGSYLDTTSDDNVFWITAPVSPAVDGFGLSQTLQFDLAMGRVPTQLEIRGYWSGGGGASADVYALNNRTGVYDKLTNSSTNLINRNSETVYAITIPRDYGDDSNGLNNIIRIQLRSTSTNTSHRLRIDQALVYHIDEVAAFTSTSPTSEEIWTYVSRTLTTPGTEPDTSDSEGVATLLTRITDLVQTKAQADADQAAVIAAVETRATPADLLVSVESIVTGIEATYPDNFAALGINVDGHVSRVTLVDTTTNLTNNDIANAGDWAITRTFETSTGDKIPGVRTSLVGVAGKSATSASDGLATVKTDNGTYTLRTVPPFGYEDVADTEVTISGADDTATVVLTSIVLETAESPLCAVVLPIVNQYGTRLPGVKVLFMFTGLQEGANPGAVVMSPPPLLVSGNDGTVRVNLIRLATYRAAYKIDSQTRNIAIEVPDAGGFIVVDTP